MEVMARELDKIMKELFGEFTLQDGAWRSLAEHVGAVDSNAIVEAFIDLGPEDHPYPSVQVLITLAQGIEPEAVPNLLISLNALNHVMTTGAFPSFGSIVYYAPLDQVYMSARIPFNPENIEADIPNIRFFFSTLYEQMDLFMDFVLYAVSSPTLLTIGDYLDYLDGISNLNDLKERSELLARMTEELLSKREQISADEEG